MLRGVPLPPERQCVVDGCGSVRQGLKHCGRHATQIARKGRIVPDSAAPKRAVVPSGDYEPKTVDEIMQHPVAKQLAESMTQVQRSAFRQLVSDYRDACYRISGRRFVFVRALAELVVLGWRRSEP